MRISIMILILIIIQTIIINSTKMTRIAIVDKDKCKPEKCARECMKYCPPQRSGKRVIDIEDIGINLGGVSKTDILTINNNNKSKKLAKIAENLCIGCNQCVKVCPFDAIRIVNLPEENPKDIVHRYSANGFRLYKLPIMKTNTIIGIIGENGVGKTTLIEILSDKIRPNFEMLKTTISEKDIISRFRGTVLQDYLKELYNGDLVFSVKEQKIKNTLHNIPKHFTVNDYINTLNVKINDSDDSYDSDDSDECTINKTYRSLDIHRIKNNPIHTLSGGELQRLMCWITSTKPANVYIFDEPSNYLDIKQRLEVSKLIKSLQSIGKYVIVIEHDLSLLDFICDEIYIVYGKPGAYGIVSKPLSTLEGINMYLDGFISTQNVRFREEQFNMKPAIESYDNSQSVYNAQNQENEKLINGTNVIEYPDSKVSFNNYTLNIPASGINTNNNIIVVMGENGTGKTTFINWIAKKLGMSVSLKEQSTNIKKYEKNGAYPTVSELINKKIKSLYYDKQFQTDVVQKLDIELLESRYINELSGGEMQRVMILLCLGTQADIYLIDEPSANLDVDYRLKVTKMIKRYMINNKKIAYIIEHDIMMSVSFAQELGSKILIIKQEQINKDNVKICSVSSYLDFHNGINNVLKLMNITMRLSNHNRPRINKCNSQLEQEQKKQGNYYGV